MDAWQLYHNPWISDKWQWNNHCFSHIAGRQHCPVAGKPWYYRSEIQTLYWQYYHQGQTHSDALIWYWECLPASENGEKAYNPHSFQNLRAQTDQRKLRS